MNDPDYENYLKFQEWQKQQGHYRHDSDNDLNIVESINKPKRTEVLIPLHWIYAAAAGSFVLLILAFPFTIFGFVLGLFTRWNFLRNKKPPE